MQSADVILCSDDLWRVTWSVDGLAPPIEQWQKAINDQLEKIRKLEETYENELILKKVPAVNHLSLYQMCTVPIVLCCGMCVRR